MTTYERASTYVASKTPVRWDIVDNTEVIIVGTSITSLTLAVDLARRGISFVLLKTNMTRSADVDATSVPEMEVPVSNTCGECFGIFGLQPRSLEVYEDLGVIEAIMAKATPLRGERMIIDGQVTLDWNYDTEGCDSHYKLPITIEQCEVERILYEKLVELGHGDCIQGPVEIMGVSDSGPRVWCRYRAVMPLTDVFLNPLETPHSTPSQVQSFHTAPTTDQFINGKYLVGCDGSNSVVRRHLGIPYPGCAVNTARFVIADAVMDWGISPECDKVTLLFADGYATVAMHLKDNIWRLTIISHNVALPTDPKREDAQTTKSTASGGSSCTRGPHTPPMRPGQFEGDDCTSTAGSMSSRSSVWQHSATAEDEEEIPPPTREDLTFLMQRVVPDAVCTELLWCSWTPIISRCCPTFHKGRSYLAGDAAHIIPPLFMQGLNTGIQDAHNIGWKLAQVIKGTAPPALLETYTIERQPVNYHLRLFATLPGRQIAEGNMWIFKFFKYVLPHALDIKSVNQAMTRKISQLAIQYSKGLLVGSRRISSGLRPGQRCPDGMITHLHSSGELSFSRLHEVFSGPKHVLMTLLHLPSLADTLATLRANADTKKISDTRLMELAIDDALTLVADMTKLLQTKTAQSWGGVKNVMVLTSGKPVATPSLPAVTGSEVTEETIAKALTDPSHHASQFATYVNNRYLLKTESTPSVGANSSFCLGWDSECEITSHINWGLSPYPQTSFQSVMQTMGSWTKGSIAQAVQDGTADAREIMDAVTSRFGSKYGAFALIRPDGHVTHTGYLSDFAARKEATDFTRQYFSAHR